MGRRRKTTKYGRRKDGKPRKVPKRATKKEAAARAAISKRLTRRGNAVRIVDGESLLFQLDKLVHAQPRRPPERRDEAGIDHLRAAIGYLQNNNCGRAMESLVDASVHVGRKQAMSDPSYPEFEDVADGWVAFEKQCVRPHTKRAMSGFSRRRSRAR